MPDRETAQDRVAELMAAKLSGRRHHPAHAQRRADLFDVAVASRARADHFLQRHDVGVDGAQNGRDPMGACAAVDSPTPMDVVGADAEGRRAVVTHYVMIVRGIGRFARQS